MKKLLKFLSVFLISAASVVALASCKDNEDGGQKPVGTDLKILKEEDESMINTYTLIAVDPAAPFVDEATGDPRNDVAINTVGADALINWFLSASTKQLVVDYGKADFGDSLFYWKDGAPSSTATIPQATNDNKTIRLSTTTSVKDSGLLGSILPVFESTYGYTVSINSAGTGKAINAARWGNADLILVHSKSQEEVFTGDVANDGGNKVNYARVIEGQTAKRLSFMYNYFVLVGPSSDPVGAATKENVKASFKAISDNKALFVSRGDESGTHTAELKLWDAELGITAAAASHKAYSDWYISSGAGMGITLTLADRIGAYTFSDKATFLTFQKNYGQATK